MSDWLEASLKQALTEYHEYLKRRDRLSRSTIATKMRDAQEFCAYLMEGDLVDAKTIAAWRKS